jgi:hypothetical protein
MTLLLAVDRRGSAMAEEFENYEARLEAARRAVERWETEGGARETEHGKERTADAASSGDMTLPPQTTGETTHERGHATERETMNGTTLRRMQLRGLARRVARARLAVTQQTLERESVIRRDGGAHPRSIRASRRLSRTLAAYRDLLATYRRHLREAAGDGR